MHGYNYPLPILSLALSSVLLFSCAPPWERTVHQSKQNTASLTSDAYQLASRLPDDNQQASADNTDNADNTDKKLPQNIHTLDQLISWGLVRNPRISARVFHMRAQESTIAQVSMPDPVLKAIPFGDMAETAAGTVAYGFGLEQKFPAPGVLGAQAQQASAKTKTALAQFESEKIAIAFQIRVAWHTYQWAQASLDITAKQIEVLEQLRHVILVRVEAQTATQSEAIRIGVVIDGLKAKRRSWSERVRNAKTSLVSVLNTDQDIQFPQVLDDDPIQSFNDGYLDAIARSARPEFIANQAATEMAAAKGLLARAKKRPAFGTFFNYTAVDDSGLSAVANGQDQWQIGFSLTLPVWRSAYAAADAEAMYLHEQARFEREAITDSIYQDTHNAWETQKSTAEQLKIVRIDMLGGAQRALQLETASYEAGRTTYQDVIQSWRNLFAAELQETYLVKSYAIAIAGTIRALGLSTHQQLREHMKQFKQKKAE